MNPWQTKRRANSWSKGYLQWQDPDHVYISAVFSWQLQQAFANATFWAAEGKHVIAGGPAVAYQPSFLADVADCSQTLPDAIRLHNPNATFTTRGCLRQCPFCAVPTIEGSFHEIPDFTPRPIVCDNNFLASSRAHFDRVIDALKPLEKVDFNQGLDARLLTKYHADRIAELDTDCIRLAWDTVAYESAFRRAWHILREAGFSKRHIRVYVLFGFDDTPDDALHRFTTIWRELGSYPWPQRYQPLDTPKKNAYIAPNWTPFLLTKFQRYWANIRYLSNIPFTEFDPYLRKPKPTTEVPT